MRLFVLLAALVALPAYAGNDLAGSPLHFTLPEGWKPRSDLALAIGEGMVDRRGQGGALVYRDEHAGATLQGAFGVRALDGEDGAHAKAAFQDGVVKNGLAGWSVDKRERQVAGKSEIVRVEAHDGEGLRSITWSAAALDGKTILSGLLQCIYPPSAPTAARDCRAIVASAKLTKLAP
jgi:hypothetical protein